MRRFRLFGAGSLSAATRLLPGGLYHRASSSKVHKTRIRERESAMEAIARNPRCCRSLTDLAVTMSATETVTLGDGRSMTQRQLLLTAIANDPKYHGAYYTLGWTLCQPPLPDQKRTVNLPNGECVTARDLFVKCINIYPKCSSCLSMLASEMRSDTCSECLTLQDGWKRVTRRQLYVEAIRCKSDNHYAIRSLGHLMSADDMITLHDGRLMTKTDLESMAAAVQK